jgi:hypothetical protein
MIEIISTNSERMQCLDQETTRQAQKEKVEAQRQARQAWAIEGDAVAGDGTLLFTNHCIGTQAPNVGDNSRVSRNQYANSLAPLVTNYTATQCPIPHCADNRNMPDHKCRHCKTTVHNWCAQREGLCFDENEHVLFIAVQTTNGRILSSIFTS